MDIIPASSQLSEVSRPALIVLLFGLLAFAGISIPLRTSSASKAAERNIIRTPVPNPPLALTVNNTSDDTDASAGDGVCDTDLVTSGEQCSLRAAIQEANASLIDTTISFDAGLINSSITLESALPDLTANVTITGLGVTSLTIQRDSAVATPEFRIFRVAPSVTAAISGLKISNGKLTGTNNGGGILNDGTLTVTSCNLENNSADQSGGAIYNNGTSLTLTDCNIGGLSAGQGNSSSGPGSGLYSNSGNLSVSGGAIFGNASGGGVFVGGGTAVINGTTISNNSDSVAGGGVANLNAGTSTTIVNSLIDLNSATDGAGIYNQAGTMDIANSTISANTASGFGGGARNQSGTLTFTNVTVTTNRTTNAGTLAGGLSVSGIVNLRNTIVAGNFRGASPSTTAGDISGSVSFSNSFNNLIGTGGSSGLVNSINGNFTGVLNPRLGPLANNGGATMTHALLSGSQALDAGSNTFVTNPPFTGSSPFTDQRGTGYKRVLDAADAGATQTVDIGAYEANPTITDIPNTTVNEDASIPCIVYNVGDETEGFSSIVASSSNQTLVKDANINPNLPNGSGSRCLSLVLEADQFGTSTISITVTGHNGLTASDSFLLTVNAIGDAPSVTPATANEDTQTSSGLAITKNPADGAEVTQFYITNIQNGTLYRSNGISPISNNSFITLTEGSDGLKFTPAVNLNSSSDSFGFTVQAATSAGVSSAGTGTNASITVNAINDPPSFTKGSSPFVNQQAGAYTFTNWATNISAGAPNESSQTLTFQVTGNTNPGLFSVQPAISSSGTLTFTGTPNTTGSSQITINLKDNAGGADTSPSDSFTIIITHPPITPVVNTPGDATDINVGDRVCDTDPAAGNQCTLRAALQETNATGAASGNTITFSLPAQSVISLNTPLPDIGTNLTVMGPGASSLTVQRASGAPNFRIFYVLGLNLVVSMSDFTMANGSLGGNTFPGSSGAGIYSRGTLTLNNMNLSGHNAGFSGGAIMNDGGSLTVGGCLFASNVSGASGGGIANRGTATINQSTFAGNTAAGSGGGISNSTGDAQNAVLTVTNSTFSSNTAQAGGGGIFNIGTASITNTTISMNSSPSGGGLANLNPLTLNNVTITGNTGVGMYNPGIGFATINNTIIAGNTSAPDCDCGNDGGDYNLFGNTTGMSFAPPGAHTITNVNALLGPLADNGGPTKTHALLVGSPAIDAGNSSQTTDQRGQPRPVDDPTVATASGGNGTDIGAYEAHNLQVNTVIDADDGACTSAGAGNGCTLREAINAANAQTGGELISFAPALTAGSPAIVALNSPLPNLTSDLIIAGSGANLLTVRRNTAGGNFRIFTINSGIVVKVIDLTISNGHPSDGAPGSEGGAISNAGTLTVTGCTIDSNQAGDGASLGGSANGGSGGGIFSSGPLTVTNSTITNNRSGNGLGGGFAGSGAAIFSSNSLTMTGSTISNNQAGVANAGGGSGAITSQGTATITNTSVAGNSRTGISSAGTLLVTNVTVTGNTNGGIFNGPSITGGAGTGTIKNSLISGNGGSGIVNNVSGNTAANLTVINTTVSNNTAQSLGGGIFNGAGSFTSHASLTVINSTISGNTAVNGGGGIYNAAVFSSATSDAVIVNTTISGNFDNSQGGGIFDISSTTSGHASLTLNNCTVANNSVGNGGIGGGGIATSTFNSITTLTLQNSIVAANISQSGAAASDVAGSVDLSSSFNLIGLGGAGGLTNGTNGNQVGISSPLLGPLANNGGATQTQALLPGSPALNTGSNGNLPADIFDLDGDGNPSESVPFDQRGFARVTNSTVDIGAFESRGFTIAATGGTPQSATITSAFSTPLSATVSSSFGEPVANGLITFAAPVSGASGTFTGGLTTMTATANSSGVATSSPFTANNLGGSYAVSAGANGIPFPASFSLTNLQAATTIAVSSSVNPSNLGQSVTFTTTVSSGAGTPTGMVQFKDGGSNLGSPVTLISGVAQLTTSSLIAGSHTIMAEYSGDGNFMASIGTLSGGQSVLPSLSINDVSATEGDSGTKNFTFTVTLSGASNQAVTVNFATANGTATIADSDYTTTSGTLTFNPGDLTKTIGVTVNGDQKFEPNETFFVNLSGADKATISDNQGLGTIINDDAQGGIISFNSSEYTVFEADGSVTITVNRAGDTTGAATVDYSTDDTGTPGSCDAFNGFASSKCDFTTAVGTLRFAANETQKTFIVLVNRDSYTSEIPLDAFTVKLSNLTGGAVFGTNSTATVKIMESGSPGPNAIDDSAFFVRQHYHDFLNREPDASGLQFWTNEIESCGTDAACREVKRINVSGAFFLSIEFRQTGYLIERLYKTAYGDATGNSTFPSAHTLPVPIVRFNEFLADTQEIGRGVVVGQPGWEQQLENNKAAFVASFVQRQRFTSAFGSMSNAQFVDMLNSNAGKPLSQAERDQLVADLNNSAKPRAQVLRAIGEHPSLVTNEFNRAFVLMQFFGYMRRNPDDPQDHDHTGYDFWLTKLNQFGGNFQNAEMVKAFITSDEYRHRFGP